jgi:hypothetical protein
MRRAYLLIAVPAALVGIGYALVLRYIGVPVHGVPFGGAALAFVAAILIVRHYQRRKSRRHGNS